MIHYDWSDGNKLPENSRMDWCERELGMAALIAMAFARLNGYANGRSMYLGGLNFNQNEYLKELIIAVLSKHCWAVSAQLFGFLGLRSSSSESESVRRGEMRIAKLPVNQ